MKVEDLIKRLSEMPPDSNVVCLKDGYFAGLVYNVSIPDDDDIREAYVAASDVIIAIGD